MTQEQIKELTAKINKATEDLKIASENFCVQYREAKKAIIKFVHTSIAMPRPNQFN